jgi:hypothetical protein
MFLYSERNTRDVGRTREKFENHDLRQILAIQGLDYNVKYNKGKENIADYGSRHITKKLNDKTVREVSLMEEEINVFIFEPNSERDHTIIMRALQDDEYQLLKRVIEENLWKTHKKHPEISRFLGVAPDLSVVKGVIFFRDLLVPPFIMQRAFVDEAHKMGHTGEKRAVDLLREKIWFPGMTKLAKDMVKQCMKYQMTQDRTYDEPLKPIPLPRHAVGTQ